MIRSDEWALEQGLVLYQGKVYISKNTKLQTEIIKLHHDSLVAGHPGQWKTLKLISRNYWWPGIIQKVNDYISGCNKYQQMKSFPDKPAGKLKPNESTTAPCVMS